MSLTASRRHRASSPLPVTFLRKIVWPWCGHHPDMVADGAGALAPISGNHHEDPSPRPRHQRRHSVLVHLADTVGWGLGLHPPGQ